MVDADGIRLRIACARLRRRPLVLTRSQRPAAARLRRGSVGAEGARNAEGVKFRELVGRAIASGGGCSGGASMEAAQREHGPREVNN
jgi:hypothetical protein